MESVTGDIYQVISLDGHGFEPQKRGENIFVSFDHLYKGDRSRSQAVLR